jgi:hypothetical protein
LEKLISQHNLLAFAENFIIRIQSKQELQEVVAALEGLEAQYDLALNKTKLYSSLRIRR